MVSEKEDREMINKEAVEFMKEVLGVSSAVSVHKIVGVSGSHLSKLMKGKTNLSNLDVFFYIVALRYSQKLTKLQKEDANIDVIKDLLTFKKEVEKRND